MKKLDPLVVILNNGDLFRCDFKSIAGDRLVVYHQGKMIHFALSEVQNIYPEAEYDNLNKSPAPKVAEPKEGRTDPSYSKEVK